MRPLILIFILLTSCQSQRVLEGKAKLVTFTSQFNLLDSLNILHPLGYSDLYGINISTINLKNNQSNSILISYPTFFTTLDPFLIYPGEKISVKYNENGDCNLFVPESSIRNAELSFFKDFFFLSRLYGKQIKEIAADDIIGSEEALKKRIEFEGEKSNYIFDSLCLAKRVRKKFRDVAKIYIRSTMPDRLLTFYLFNKDSLMAKNLFIRRIKDLLPLANSIVHVKEILYGYNNFLSGIADILLPTSISDIHKNNEFQLCFDSANVYFKGIARDFIEAKILYTSLKNRIPIPDNYVNYFFKNCKSKEYKSIIKKFLNRQKKNDLKTKSMGTNSLLTMKNKKVTNIENIIKKNKGRLILLNFWATWCQPCIEELPASETLEKKYANKNIVFIKLSLDKDIQHWKKFVNSEGMGLTNNFIFNNFQESEFCKQYKIETIPRQILIGKDGTIIEASTPSLKDPKLRELINKNL